MNYLYVKDVSCAVLNTTELLCYHCGSCIDQSISFTATATLHFTCMYDYPKNGILSNKKRISNSNITKTDGIHWKWQRKKILIFSSSLQWCLLEISPADVTQVMNTHFLDDFHQNCSNLDRVITRESEKIDCNISEVVHYYNEDQVNNLHLKLKVRQTETSMRTSHHIIITYSTLLLIFP